MMVHSNLFAQQKLRIGLIRFPENFDPASALTYTDKTVRRSLFRNLIRLSTEGQIFGDLAKWWSVSKDFKTYEMCAEAAKFHDGRPIEFEDIKFSLLRNSSRGRFPKIEDHREFEIHQTPIKSQFSSCFKITFKASNKDFLSGLADVSTVIVPRDFNPLKPVGSGEYSLATSDLSGGSFSFRYVGKPSPSVIQEIDFKKITSDIEGLQAIENDKIDILFGATDLQRLIGQEGKIRVHGLSVNAFIHLFLNADRPAFKDRNFREAFLRTIQKVIRETEKPNQLLKNADSFIPQGMLPSFYYQSQQDQPKQKTQSWAKHLQGQSIHLISCFNELSDETKKALGDVIKGFGGKDLVYEYDFAAYIKHLENRDYDLIMACVPSRIPSIKGYLYPLRPATKHSFTNADFSPQLRLIFKELERIDDSQAANAIAYALIEMEKSYYFIPLYESKLAIPTSTAISITSDRFSYGLRLTDFKKNSQ